MACPIETQDTSMRKLREAMNADLFDVPFRSEGFAGKDWHNIEPYEDSHAN